MSLASQASYEGPIPFTRSLYNPLKKLPAKADFLFI
jgi:hypothetical protein